MGKRHADQSQHEFETPIKKQRALQSPPEPEDSPRPEFTLTKELAEHTILTDLMQGQWRIGKPIGKLSLSHTTPLTHFSFSAIIDSCHRRYPPSLRASFYFCLFAICVAQHVKLLPSSRLPAAACRRHCSLDHSAA